MHEAAFHPDNKTLVVLGIGIADVLCFDRDTGKRLSHLRPGGDGIGLTMLSPRRDLVGWYNDRAFVVHELASGKRLCEIAVGAGDIPIQRHAVFSGDGRNVVAVQEHGAVVSVCDAKTGQAVRRLDVPEDAQIGGELIASPDGKRAMALSLPDDAMCVWDLDTGQRVYMLRCRQGIEPLFSPDGAILATAADDRGGALAGYAKGSIDTTPAPTEADGWGLVLRDAATGKPLFGLKRKGAVDQIAFSPDSKTLALAEEDGTIHLWDIARRREVRTLVAPGVVRKLVFAGDGRSLVAVTIYDAAQGKPTRRTAPPNPEEGSYVQPEEHRSMQWRLQRWCLPDGNKSYQIAMPTTISGNSCALSDDGAMLAAVDGNIIRRWDMATGKELPVPDGPTDEVTQLVVAPDGRTIATVHGDKQFVLWNAQTQKQRASWSCAVTSTCRPCFTPDGNELVALAQEQGVCYRWDAAAGKLRAKDALHEDSKNYVNGLTPDGRPVGWALGAEGLALVDLISGKPRVPAAADKADTPRSILMEGLFSPDGRRFACAALDRSTQQQFMQWDVERRRELPRITASFWQGVPASYSADGRFLAALTASAREDVDWPVVEVGCWEVATAKRCLRYELPPLDAVRVALSPDGRRVALSTTSGKLQLWDIVTAKPLGELPGHVGPVTALQFSADGKTLFSAGKDTTVLIWDVNGLQPPRMPLGTLEQGWADLAREDPAIAYRAVWAMVGSPARAVEFLATRLKPAARPDGSRVQRWLTDVGSDQLDTRQAALGELERLGCQIEGQVEQALKSATRLETRCRLEHLLGRIRVVPAPVELQRVRAVHVLELIGSSEARRLLRTLADGAAGARLTWEAEAALARLEKRAAR
jgi:WD40 repeat protein